MKKIGGLFGLLLFLLLALTSSAAFAVVQGTTSDGWKIYDPTVPGNVGYNYGPSSIINADNSIDMWTCSPGGGGAWDYIRYQRSTNGGVTWTPQQIAMQPTSGSDDALSTCDPGVFKMGGYYYMGYTSITRWYGFYGTNDVFIARSTSPTGPWDKWNGTGWGGNPKAFIYFTDPINNTYGAGEPSFVVKDGTIYIYYTWNSRDASGKPINQTRVSTASASNANWPGATTYQGIAMDKKGADDDSTDVKYVDAYNKFIAVYSVNRFTPDSYLQLMESTDGITFKPSSLPLNYVKQAAHNSGLSGDESGHLDVSKSNFVAYADGESWAAWYMYMNPISFANNNLPAIPRVYNTTYPNNGSVTINFEKSGVAGETYKIKYGTAHGSYTTTLSGITTSPYTVTGLTNGTKYYFVVVANNATGDSANSREVNETPLNYTDAPRSGITVSSTLSGWPASSIIDNNLNTSWSSQGRASAANTEWATLDTGANRAIKRVILTPRQPTQEYFPSKIKIQVSMDNVNWVDADYANNSYQLKYDNGKYVYNFNTPLWGRYVRAYATELTFDSNGAFFMQLAEFNVQEITYNVTANSTLSGWDSSKLLDGNISSAYSSVSHATAAATEWIRLDTGASQKITGISLTPRQGTVPAGIGFPVDFKLQSSPDGTTWTDIPGQAYTAYANPGNDVRTFIFSSALTTRYVRIYATKLSYDGTAYYLQLGEVGILKDNKRTAVASSALSGWPTSRLTDNVGSTPWSSVNHASANSTEWAYIDLGSSQTVDRLRIVPRPNGSSSISFPRNFTIQSSTDAVNWTTLPRQTYIGYYWNAVAPVTPQIFQFTNLVTARYFRINATVLNYDGSAYYMQLGEIYAD